MDIYFQMVVTKTQSGMRCYFSLVLGNFGIMILKSRLLGSEAGYILWLQIRKNRKITKQSVWFQVLVSSLLDRPKARPSLLHGIAADLFNDRNMLSIGTFC